MNFRISNISFGNTYESTRKPDASSVDVNVNKNVKQVQLYKNNIGVSNAIKAYALNFSLPLSFKGIVTTPKIKYIPEGLTDADKIAEILLNIETDGEKRFVNNKHFRNLKSTIKKIPETSQYLDSLLTAKNGEISSYDVGLFLNSMKKAKDYDKYLNPLLETKNSCSDIRYILGSLNKDNEKYLYTLFNSKKEGLNVHKICSILGSLNDVNGNYLNKLLDASNEKLRPDDAYYILNVLNNGNKKYLDKLLSPEYEHVKGREIHEILSEVNPDNEKYIDKLLNVRKDKEIYVSEILSVINNDNEKYLDTLLNVRKNRELYLHNILAVLNEGNLKHFDALLANEALSSSDIAIVLNGLNESSSQKDVEELIQKQVSQHAHYRNYSRETKALMSEMRDIALSFNLPDFYSGKKFDIKKYSYATIEHLVPHSQKARAAVEGFDVNSLANFVPVDSDLNSIRQRVPLSEWYKMNPKYVENSKAALIEYEKVNTPLINGKEWVAQLKANLNKELGQLVFV